MQGYCNIRDLINVIKYIDNFKIYDFCTYGTKLKM